MFGAIRKMKRKGRLTYRNFSDYFGNKLGRKEKHAFEKQMMQDSFESEAFDGLSKLNADELEKDMADLNALLQARTQESKRRIPVWLPYAASLTILLALGSVLYYLNQYSPQDEMIGSQMEEIMPKVDKPVIEPKITVQDTESVGLMRRIEQDLEVEISDTDETEDIEISMLNDEEEELLPIEKSIHVESIAAAEPLPVAKKASKKVDEEVLENAESALQGQVAGLQIQESARAKSAKKKIAVKSKQNARMISGQVIDEDEMPLPGVNILIKGTERGVVTDLDGKFTLDPSEISQDYKLVASFIGFESKEINGQADSSLLVVLETDQASMDEVVVVGYGISTSKTEHGNTSWHKAKPKQFASIAQFKEHLVQEIMNANLGHLQGAYKVKFSFVIEPYGTLSDIKFKGNPDEELRKEIERLLLLSEDWYPAESGGNALASKVKIKLQLNFE